MFSVENDTKRMHWMVSELTLQSTVVVQPTISAGAEPSSPWLVATLSSV